MTDTHRPDPFLIADSAALDFMNSECFFGEGMIEWITDGADLLDWLERAGLITAVVKASCQEEFSQKALDDVAKRARDLRVWLRSFVEAEDNTKPDLKALTDILEGDSLHWVVVVDEQDGALKWVQKRAYKKASDLLLPIAEAIGDFICNRASEHTKNCEGPQCTLWFQDITKNHKRRWCSMSVCGNRAKVAAHRERKRLRG